MSQFESIDKVLKEGRLSVQKLRENSNLLEQPTNEQDTKQDETLKKNRQNRNNKDELYKDRSNPNSGGKSKSTKYLDLKNQRTKYNVLKNKQGVYKPSIASAKAKMGERLTNITKPPNPKAVQQNALNASPGRMKKLNKAIARAARFEPGSGKERTIKLASGKTEVKKFDKDYRTRILDRITKNQEGKIDTSKAGRIARMKAGISAKSPTIQGADKRPARFVNGKQYGGGRLPMPGAPNEVDFSTGGKGVNKKGIQTDRAVINRMGRDASKEEIAKAKRQQAAYDKQVKANQAKLKTPGGAKYYTGKNTPLNKGVFGLGSGSDLQKVYDDLSSETSGKDARIRGKNQPSYAQVKAEIDKKYPVKRTKTGLIPDKSSGAYGSANDRVAVSADGKTRIKAPNYNELKRNNKKIIKKIKNIVKDKPSTNNLYDPLKTKIPTIKPVKSFIKTPPKLEPLVKTATKSKPLLAKIATKIPKSLARTGKVGLALGGAALLYTALKGDKKSKKPTPLPIVTPPPSKKDFEDAPINLRLGSKEKGMPTASNPTANTTRLNSLTNRALLAKQNRNT